LIFTLAISAIVLSGASARADDFGFSFTETAVTTGSWVPPNFLGTVTGEILGVTNNSTSIPTEVIVTSVAAPGFLYPFPSSTVFSVNPTSWVTETNGQITSIDLIAGIDYFGPKNPPADGQYPAVYGISFFSISGTGTSASIGYSVYCPNCLNPQEVVGANTLALDTGTLTITPLVDPSPVPEPASLMLFGTGLAGFAGAVRRRFLR
jgi:hypothetical protein